MSLEVQNGKLQMFFEPQNQRNKVEKARREGVIFCFKFVFTPPLTSNNYILFISHSFLMISKTTNALSQNQSKFFKVKRQKKKS
jgi:hypothetical protein